jgi:hypothetical protein
MSRNDADGSTRLFCTRPERSQRSCRRQGTLPYCVRDFTLAPFAIRLRYLPHFPHRELTRFISEKFTLHFDLGQGRERRIGFLLPAGAHGFLVPSDDGLKRGS